MFFSDESCGWSQLQAASLEHILWRAGEGYLASCRLQTFLGGANVVLPDGTPYRATSWPQLLIYNSTGEFSGSILGYRPAQLLEFEIGMILNGGMDVQTLMSALRADPTECYARWHVGRHVRTMGSTPEHAFLESACRCDAPICIANALDQLYADYETEWPCLDRIEAGTRREVRFWIYWNLAIHQFYHLRDHREALVYFRLARFYSELGYHSFIDDRIAECSE